MGAAAASKAMNLDLTAVEEGNGKQSGGGCKDIQTAVSASSVLHHVVPEKTAGLEWVIHECLVRGCSAVNRLRLLLLLLLRGEHHKKRATTRKSLLPQSVSRTPLLSSSSDGFGSVGL